MVIFTTPDTMDSDAGDTRASTPINSTHSTHSASDFLADGKYYDVLVHSCEENGDATYLKLHRLIACPQSEMLASLCEKAQKTSKPPEVLTIRGRTFDMLSLPLPTGANSFFSRC